MLNLPVESVYVDPVNPSAHRIVTDAFTMGAPVAATPESVKGIRPGAPPLPQATMRRDAIQVSEKFVWIFFFKRLRI